MLQAEEKKAPLSSEFTMGDAWISGAEDALAMAWNGNGCLWEQLWRQSRRFRVRVFDTSGLNGMGMVVSLRAWKVELPKHDGKPMRLPLRLCNFGVGGVSGEWWRRIMKRAGKGDVK